MSGPHPVQDPHGIKTDGLPRRDLIILPALVIATVLCLGLGAELIGRIVWANQRHDSCEVWRGPVSFFKPYCKTSFKLAEGPSVEYKYNDCGYRSASSCRAKPANELRVAVLGTSIAHGYAVSYPNSFVGRAESDLSRRCRRPVDFQAITVDEARGAAWHTLASRVDEAAALKPDVIVSMISPTDLLMYSQPPTTDGRTDPSAGAAATPQAKPGGPKPGLIQLAHSVDFDQSYALFTAQHLIYGDPKRYIALFMKHGDQADFLRPPFARSWQMRLKIADATLANIAAQARAHHIPLVIVFVPTRAQAILSSWKDVPKGVDVYALDRAVDDIALRNRANFVDVTNQTRITPHVATDFYPVDGHPNEAGHAIIADALEAALLSSTSNFSTCDARPIAH